MSTTSSVGHARTGTIVLVGTVLGQAVGYAYNVYLARGVGAFGYGQLSQLLSLSALFASITQIGLNRAAVRFSAVHFGRGEASALKGTLIITFGAVSLASFFLGIAGVLAARFLATHYLNDPGLIWPVILTMAIGSLTALFNITMELLRGVGNATHRTYIEGLLQKILRFGAVSLAPHPPGLTYLLMMELAVMASGLVLGLESLRRQVASMLSCVRAVFHASDLWRFTLPLVPAAVAGALTLQAETVLLGWTRQTREVAVFNAALRTAAVGEILFTAFYTNFAPSVSALRDTGRTGELILLFRQYTLWVSVLVSLWAGGMIIASPELLTVFGGDYRSGSQALVLLCISKVIAALFGPVGLMVTMSGHGLLTLFNMVVWMLASYGVGMLLIPGLGASGAAASLAIALLVGHLSPTYQVWKLYSVVGTSWRAVLIAGLSMLSALTIGAVRSASSGFLGSIAGCVLSEWFYFVVMVALIAGCLSASDRRFAVSFLSGGARRLRSKFGR